MTDHDMYDDSYVHTLSGAYAVDALDEVESARFEEHLRGCAACRDEVDSLRETAAALGTEEIEPPPELREQVLAGIEHIRPLPPLLSDDTETTAGTDELAARRRHRLPLLLVAAALVVLAGAAAIWIAPWSGDDPAPPTAIERVLDAEDADESTRTFDDGSTATVVVARSEGRAVIVTDDMAPAPQGKDYQLWLQEPDGEMVPAGVMPDRSDATVLLDAEVENHTGVGITLEPDGGSAQPTSEPIALFTLDG